MGVVAMKHWLKDNHVFVLIVSMIVFGLLFELFIKQMSNVTNEQEKSVNQTPALSVLETAAPDAVSATPTQSVPNEAEMYVDIKGEVDQPGVYRVSGEDRVVDAVEEAGGFLKTADLSKVNLAARVHDEMVIYVPHIDAIEANEKLDLYSSPIHDKINVNVATQEQLETLPGIGSSKAQQIIKHRETNGRFESVSDLTQVSGIGEKTVANFEELVTVQ